MNWALHNHHHQEEELKDSDSKVKSRDFWRSGLMGFAKMQQQQQELQHSVAVKMNNNNDQIGNKKGSTFIQEHRALLPKAMFLWIIIVGFLSREIYQWMDDTNKVRREEVLVSMCDQRARMLQDQFSVSVNHVHALAILVSTFHYHKTPSAIDQVSVCVCVWLVKAQSFGAFLGTLNLSVYVWLLSKLPNL